MSTMSTLDSIWSKTKVTGKLVTKSGDSLEDIDNIQIFEGGSLLKSKKTDNSGQFTFNFTSKDFDNGNKDKLSLTLKLPTPVTTIDPQSILRLSDPSLKAIAFHLKQGQVIEFSDFYYEASGGIISGIVFFDEEENHNPKENPPLQGVKVTLRQKDYPPEEQEVLEVMTDAQGFFSYDDLDAGLYQLTLDSTLNANKFNLEGGLLRLYPHEQTVYLAQGEEQECNFGYRLTKGTVRGIVFCDHDRSGGRFGNEPGLPGVRVILVDDRGDTVGSATTNNYGEYSIDVAPGTYTLKFASVVYVDGEEQTLTGAETETITVKAAETVQAKPVGYQPEIHAVIGKVTYEDDTPIEGIVVILADEEDEREIDRTVTDAEGEYVFNTNYSGKYTIKFPDPPFEGQLLTPQQKTLEVNSIARFNAVYRLSADRDGGRIGDGGAFGGNAREALFDIASYMPTAQDNLAPSSRGGGSDRGSGDLKYIVDSAFSEVLGRNLNNDDPKTFLASLERAFTAEEVKGKTQYKWTPRSYAVQTELGGKISGAQASLYHRAKIAIDDAKPLLDGLKPLKSDYDQEEVEAARAIVRLQMLELVSELGLEGGPRIQRVGHIFDLINTQLDRFREVFGLERSNVITVEEEQNFTNFLVIEDYIKGLEQAWSEFLNDFTGIGSGYLGTQLVLLSRTLSVVAESVAEAYRAMDHVALGPSERRTIPIKFSQHDNSSIYLEDLMSWIEHFASQEAPALIQDGGKRGVHAIQPVADNLSKLTKGAIEADVPHVGFKTERVKRALRELAFQLNEVSRLAKEIQ